MRACVEFNFRFLIISSNCPQTSAYRRNIRNSGSLNPFPVTNLRPEVELMYLLHMSGSLNANMTPDVKLEVEMSETAHAQ